MLLLLYVLIALLTVGVQLPCLLDVAIRPRHEFDVPSKGMWLLVVTVFWVFGAITWLAVGRREWEPLVPRARASRAAGQQRALRRHPATQAAASSAHSDTLTMTPQTPRQFVAPDDNPAFLNELSRRIRQQREED